MIKLKTTLKDLAPVARDSRYAHDALVAHAYQEACNELDDGNNEHSRSIDTIERLATAKLKSWGIENG